MSRTTAKIDWRAVITDALPSFLRNPLIIALLLAASAPLRVVYERFLELAEADRYHLEHNGQVCLLLGLLEDRYPSALGIRYRIEDITPTGRVVDTFSQRRPRVPVAHPASSSSPKALDTYRETDNSDTTGFRVYVPRDIYDSQLSAVQYLVEQYKLPTRRAVFLPTDH